VCCFSGCTSAAEAYVYVDPCFISISCPVLSLSCSTNNYYCGNDKSMLIPNCLFRSNGSAVLLSNKAGHVRRAKYNIAHIVRTNMAANDVAYNCVMQVRR
jgi:3-ketoacyl-CoA synthase